MTWMSTWPERHADHPGDANGRPQYATHPTETAAEAHAREVVKSKRALVATVFWSENTTMTKENVA